MFAQTNKPDESAIRRFQGNLGKFPFVHFNYLDLEDLVTKILQRHHEPVDGEMTFIDSCYFQKSDGPLKAIVAAVPATDIINLVVNPHDATKINEDVFNENIRVDLGLKNTINYGIYESALSEENYEFWYLNNGITVVCDKCCYMPNTRSPRAVLKNAQIVNCGRTTRTLFHANAENPERIKNVDILIKIIEIREREISEKISETANKQTPVRTRDLHANDWIQKKLESEFQSLGYLYERKKNQYLKHPVGKRIDAEVIGQVSLAYYLDMPSEAKNKRAIVFGEKYHEIFNEETTTAEVLLIPYQLYKS